MNFYLNIMCKFFNIIIMQIYEQYIFFVMIIDN